MKTFNQAYDIEPQAGHHAARRLRAQHRGSARRHSKQALSHLTHAVMFGVPFADEDDDGPLLFSGSLPAEVVVE